MYKDRIANELIALGVPMIRRIGGDWSPCILRTSGTLIKLNGRVVRGSVVAQAQVAGLVR